MCNLYNMTPKGEAERYLGTIGVDLEDYEATTVGPYQMGLFVKPGKHPDTSRLVGRLGQWGMIRPDSTTSRPASRAILTNNARIEDITKRITYLGAWRKGQRCLILASWYQEPNWETGKNIWWKMRRADGEPWALAGLWSEWTDPVTGELLANYTMITCNCDGHPLLARLHKPERDPKTNEVLPPEKQDKRAVVHIDKKDWDTWLHGTAEEAAALIKPTAAEVFDPSDALNTDEILERQRQEKLKPAAPTKPDEPDEPMGEQGLLF
jgi:putative SOS response-associated peptidase YedK